MFSIYTLCFFNGVDSESKFKRDSVIGYILKIFLLCSGIYGLRDKVGGLKFLVDFIQSPNNLMKASFYLFLIFATVADLC